jgi:hypothetical protein
MAIGPDGTPYVAWEDDGDGDKEIYVRRWKNNRWEEVGTGSATDGGISDNDGLSLWPSIAIAPDGVPYVAWADTSGESLQIYVLRWDGYNWREVGSGSASDDGISKSTGGISTGAGFSDPSMAIDPGGEVYIAWVDGSSGRGEVYVRRWNGSSWEEVGSGSASGGGISDDGTYSFNASIAVGRNGIPYVAWEYNYDLGIYVRRWNGSRWEEVGPGSASGRGIMYPGNWGGDPFVAIAPDGKVYVAWESDRDPEQIHIKRWIE